VLSVVGEIHDDAAVGPRGPALPLLVDEGAQRPGLAEADVNATESELRVMSSSKQRFKVHAHSG
jgi:hypothetical protein